MKIDAIAILILLITSSVKVSAQTAEKSHPVLIELFTSEGCSSCPPSDEVMAELQKEYSQKHKPVYFIAFHVDYWNYLGWKDRFSSKENTSRQNEYANAFGSGSIYTPQAVVNGTKELIGSKRQQLKETIDKELNASNQNILSLQAVHLPDQNKIRVYYSYPSSTTDKEIYFVLAEKQQTSKVLTGENRGRTLKHINIVKQLEHFSLEREKNYEFLIKDKITASDYLFLIFVQHKISKKVLEVVEGF